MKQIVVVSGKGGTGKTVVTASLAALMNSKIMVDADVDAANLYILLHAQMQETHAFTGGNTAVVDKDLCTACGLCLEACRFDAIQEDAEGKVDIDPLFCEGCDVCFHVCPTDAIQMVPNRSGDWFVSSSAYGPFVHAKLGIAEENSGKLVSVIRKKASEIAERDELEYILVDGPPGVGCPVIASLTGADLALIVTEPTVSGLHDMKRVFQLIKSFSISSACCINKYDLNAEKTAEIEAFCRKNGIQMVGRIPYDKEVVMSMVKGVPAVVDSDSPASQALKSLFSQLILQLS